MGDQSSGHFLPNPATIRQAVCKLQQEVSALDLAVAFIGTDWERMLPDRSSDIRVICWLSSTNTNPYAVEKMMTCGIKVKQRDSMHCKVYVGAWRCRRLC